tara:strand:- start:508 stop:1002 length:495 start_codon:yes stop_codon:yes gene_type:complete
MKSNSMKNLILFILVLSFSLIVSAQDSIPTQSERINVELSTNLSLYNSLSVSIEKEFIHGRWRFGPRVELVNIFGNEPYTAEKVNFKMITQMRVRLLQLEYQVTDRVRIGVTPFWMLGPLPKQGFYKVPSSVYTHIQLKEDFSLETSLTNTKRELIQFSLRKVI